MMELGDMLGLGSSSFLKSKGSSPFFGKIILIYGRLCVKDHKMLVNIIKRSIL
jgi:hypothetical protein